MIPHAIPPRLEAAGYEGDSQWQLKLLGVSFQNRYILRAKRPKKLAVKIRRRLNNRMAGV
jgi:hypothetical protein